MTGMLMMTIMNNGQELNKLQLVAAVESLEGRTIRSRYKKHYMRNGTAGVVKELEPESVPLQQQQSREEWRVPFCNNSAKQDNRHQRR